MGLTITKTNTDQVRRLAFVCAVLLLSASAVAQGGPDVVLEDVIVDDGADFVLVPFEVPTGIAEVEVRHEVTPDDGDTVLDFGLDDPDGFRGWGGGNNEAAIVAETDASRSYLPGPIGAGTWNVVVGKARLGGATTSYRLEIFLRPEQTLSSSTTRVPYVSATLNTAPRFYAGDLHTHSRDSGDASADLDEMATFARAKGLDFVVVTDHNTNAQVAHLSEVQPRHPDLLLVPGVEFTTYQGHAGGFGVVDAVDHRVGFSTTLEEAIAAVHAQGGLFSINHPVLDLGDVCIGCAWTQELPDDGVEGVDAVEVATGGYRQSGFIFNDEARDFWDILLDGGSHAAPVGGSDDHRAGLDPPAFGSPIGDPTTLIFATSLSAEALLEGIRQNRTVVKLQGPDDPMVVLDTSPPRSGDTVFVVDVDGTGTSGAAVLTATVEGGVGRQLQWLKEGRPEGTAVDIDVDPFTSVLDVTPPDAGEERYRVEILEDGAPRVITGHVWLRREAPAESCGGCAGDGTGGGLSALGVLAILLHIRRRRRR